MTSLRPGHRPPQVTIAHFNLLGSKKIFWRGPAFMNETGFRPSLTSRTTLWSERSKSTCSLSSTHSTRFNGESILGSPRDSMVVSIGRGAFAAPSHLFLQHQ